MTFNFQEKIAAFREKMPSNFNMPGFPIKRALAIVGGFALVGMFLHFPAYVQGLVEESLKKNASLDGKISNSMNMFSTNIDGKINAAVTNAMGSMDAKVDAKLMPLAGKVDATNKYAQDEFQKVNANMAQLFRKTKIKPVVPVNGTSVAKAAPGPTHGKTSKMGKESSSGGNVLSAFKKAQSREPSSAHKPSKKKSKKK